jgi:hypothetical protein
MAQPLGTARPSSYERSTDEGVLGNGDRHDQTHRT